VSDTVEQLMDDAAGELALGELERAVALYSRCVELDPSHIEARHAQGMALMKLGRYPEAIAAAKAAIRMNPHDQILWTSLSLAYVRNNQIKEAEAAGAKAKVLSWGGKVDLTQPLFLDETPGENPQPTTQTNP
jgi:predicted Zn-dependent protease